jgi:hypothetical protein
MVEDPKLGTRNLPGDVNRLPIPPLYGIWVEWTDLGHEWGNVDTWVAGKDGQVRTFTDIRVAKAQAQFVEAQSTAAQDTAKPIQFRCVVKELL